MIHFSWRVGLAILVCGGTLACHDLSQLSGTPQLPAGTPDPSLLQNEAGALSMYRSTVAQFEYVTYSIAAPAAGAGLTVNEGAFVSALIESGLLSDELQPNNLGGSPTVYFNIDTRYTGFSADARILPEGPDASTREEAPYARLQTLRGSAAQAIGALLAYAPNTPPALRGQLYALQGYAEVLLADLYCSGVPLSTLDFDGDYTYHTGSTTAEVYQHANALFDTALVLATDSGRIENLARVGKGRALLALGQYANAATAVKDVPHDFVYQFLVDWGVSGSSEPIFGDRYNYPLMASDREGVNGLPYRSWGDPRTAQVEMGNNPYGVMRYFPQKYGDRMATSPVTVASGIEAQLIGAEADLQAGRTSNWLDALNRLRTDGSFTAAPDPNMAGQIDTTWNAGTGGIAGLKPLMDPGSDTARVTMLFNERAAWLYLTGHRQGDLRRLVRQYRRPQETVYPTGAYVAPVFPLYGTDVNIPVPAQEQVNPLFTGCLDRSA